MTLAPRIQLLLIAAACALAPRAMGGDIAAPEPVTARPEGPSLAVAVSGTFADAPHGVRLAWFDDLNAAPLGSGTFSAMSARGGISLSLPMKAAPGVYRVEAAVDGAPCGAGRFVVAGVTRNGGDLLVDGQPFSAFLWTWRDMDYVFRKNGGRFSNINVANMLRPVPAGGFGFNCVFTDDEWRLKPRDFDYLDKVGGHACVQTCIWAGLKPWGPKDWNVDFRSDPALLSDGTPARYGSFDSQRNRDNFVRDLKMFKGIFGSPRSLLGFYMFESTPDMPWDNHDLYTDYSPASKARFRQWLQAKYGSISKFNTARHSHAGSFGDIEPPADPADVKSRGMDEGYWNDWIDFRYWTMADFADWARARIKELFGPDKMLVLIEGATASYASNDSNVTGANSEFAIDERLRARASDAIGVEGTYDYMPNHVRIMRRAADFNGDGLPGVPLIMDYYNYSWQPKESFGEPAEIPRLRFVDELGEGATGGLFEHTGEWLVRWEENAPHVTEAMLGGFRDLGEVNEMRSRFQGFFLQARVPYDISVVIPVWQLRYDSRYRREARWGDHTGAAFQHALQRSQREMRMLYADEPLPPDASAIFVPTGYRISRDFVARLTEAAKHGARIYLEGVPVMDEEGHAIPFPLRDLVGATVAEETAAEFTSMDGSTLPCNEPRKLENVQGDVLARFADGSPAVVSHRVFTGQVIYCPSLVGSAAAQQGWHDAIFKTNFPEPCRRYYERIAAILSNPIARISGAASQADIRLHLLAARDAKLLLVTNWSTQPQDVTVTLGFGAAVAADLRARKPVQVSTTGMQSSLQLHLGARDWAAVGLAPSLPAMESALSIPGASLSLGMPH